MRNLHDGTLPIPTDTVQGNYLWWHWLSFDLLFFLIHLFFRKRGRERERKGEKHQCVVASHSPPTGDLACNPGTCPENQTGNALPPSWRSIHWVTPARVLPFKNSHSNRWHLIVMCDLHFPDQLCQTPFHYTCRPSIWLSFFLFFWEMSIQVLCPF